MPASAASGCGASGAGGGWATRPLGCTRRLPSSSTTKPRVARHRHTISNRRTSSPRSQRADKPAPTPAKVPGRRVVSQASPAEQAPDRPNAAAGRLKPEGRGYPPGPPQPRRRCVASGLAAVFVVLAIDGSVRSLDVHLVRTERDVVEVVRVRATGRCSHRYRRSGSD